MDGWNLESELAEKARQLLTHYWNCFSEKMTHDHGAARTIAALEHNVYSSAFITMKSLVLASNLFCWLAFDAQAFLQVSPSLSSPHALLLFQSNQVDQQASAITSVAEKIKIITFISTSCNKKREDLNMDKLTTYGAFYQRIQDSSTPMVQLEEGPCLGCCKSAPCVAIEHEDFVGTVALEGMTDSEFPDRM